MTIYFSLLAWIGTLSLLSFQISSARQRATLVTAGAVLGIILVQSLRHTSIGVDVKQYALAYETIAARSAFAPYQHYEIGFRLLCKLCSWIGLPFQGFLAITAACVTIPAGLIIHRLSPMPALSFFIYIAFGFFSFAMSGLRQAMAIAVVICAYSSIRQRRPFPFLLLVMLAASLHRSALVFLIAYPLYRLRIPRTVLPFLGLLMLCLWFLRGYAYQLASSIFPEIGLATAETGAFRMFLALCALYILTKLFGSDGQNADENAFSNCLLVACGIQLFAGQSSTIMRAGYYFSFFIALLIPMVLQLQALASTRYFAALCLVIILLLFFYVQTTGSVMQVAPYHFYFEPLALAKGGAAICA